MRCRGTGSWHRSGACGIRRVGTLGWRCSPFRRQHEQNWTRGWTRTLEGGWRVPCSQINQKQKLKITLLKREFSAPPLPEHPGKPKEHTRCRMDHPHSRTAPGKWGPLLGRARGLWLQTVGAASWKTTIQSHEAQTGQLVWKHNPKWPKDRGGVGGEGVPA